MDPVQTPPHDESAELSVLGTSLVAPAEALPLLSAMRVDDFFAPEHREAWAAMLAVVARKMPVDLLAVGDELKARGSWQRFPGGWQTWALGCAHHATAPEMAEQHAKIIAQKATLRRLIALCVEVQAAAYSSNDLEDIMGRARRGVAALELLASDKDSIRLGDALGDVLGVIEQRTLGNVKPGISYGLPALDDILGGAKPGQLILIAARPGEGKSALLEQVLVKAALSGVPGHLFSMEMLMQELAERALSGPSRVAAHAMATGKLTVDDWRDIQGAGGKLADAPLWVDDRSRHIGQIVGKIRKWHASNPGGIVGLDYVQKIIAEQRKGDSRDVEIGRVGAELKALGMELQIPIIAVAALSRAVEKRGGPPVLSDLRECGTLEYDADVVIFPYRNIPQEDQRARREPGPAQLIVGKHRGGPTGVADVYWNAPLMEWRSLGRDDDRPAPNFGNWQDKENDR
jgi:replicative DNA helicase